MREAHVRTHDSQRDFPCADPVTVAQGPYLEVADVVFSRDLRLQHPNALVQAGDDPVAAREELHVDDGVTTGVPQRFGRADEVSVRQPALADARVELKQVGGKPAQVAMQ